MMAIKRLVMEFKEISSSTNEYMVAGPVSNDNLFVWDVLIRGPDDTPYDGGCFKGKLVFPKEYPLHPPELTFTSPLWHPNIYTDGKVCISILHPPGEDRFGYEKASERWSPIQSVEKILMSVISMLAEPNDESPANIEAAKMWRNNRKEFEEKADLCVRQSLGLA